jgi:hypothetical protein
MTRAKNAPPRPALSIALATTAGWAPIAARVRALAGQVAACGGEVIVADGTGADAPPRLPDAVRWIARTGLGTFELRREALAEARGDRLVILEDHCEVGPGWCARLLDVHTRRPGADVVIGRVENGSRDRGIDWAAFLLNHLAQVPPIRVADTTRQIGIVGTSLTRDAADRLRRAGENQPLELVPTPVLRAVGLRTWIDESLAVTHIQSEGWRGHAALHFHNARAIAGLRRQAMTRRDVARLLAAPLFFAYRTTRVVARSFQKSLPAGVVATAVPGIVWLLLAKSVGECVGYLTGPGDSPRRLQ